MSPKPPPRPALRKAPDSQRHPAAPRLVVVRSDVSEAAAAAAGAGKKKGRQEKGKDEKSKDEPDTELVVRIPKALRKRLRAKAEEHGLSAEDATYELIRVWVDG
jgi:hypothetical protein